MSFLFVALGGAIGAIGRYAISLIPVKNGKTLCLLRTAGAQKLANHKPPHKISHSVICLLRFNQFL